MSATDAFFAMCAEMAKDWEVVGYSADGDGETQTWRVIWRRKG